jgi:predicted transcriptional regulator
MFKESLLASDSPRGTWEITKEGKRWLEAQMKQE